MRNVLVCAFVLAVAVATIPTGTAGATDEDIGKLKIGDWPKNESWVFFGTNVLDQTGAAGNYALMQMANVGHANLGRTALNSPLDIRFRIQNQDKMVLTSDGWLGIGTSIPESTLHVAGITRTEVLEITGGTDLAEPFEFRNQADIVPGLVASIDPESPGQLRVSTSEYDRTVVGVISGAGGINPGLVMGESGDEDAYPVALTGRVYVHADASSSPIIPGDLLTTSGTAGHVMRVTDHDRANGAILGKAMSGLEDGEGMVLMVVALQ